VQRQYDSQDMAHALGLAALYADIAAKLSILAIAISYVWRRPSYHASIIFWVSASKSAKSAAPAERDGVGRQ
jgi:hypothetical protein